MQAILIEKFPGYELTPHCAHHYIRLLIARGLRSRDDPRFVVDALIGGYDNIENKAYLGSVDYLGNSLPNQVLKFVYLQTKLFFY